jgi:hypothetical protein
VANTVVAKVIHLIFLFYFEFSFVVVFRLEHSVLKCLICLFLYYAITSSANPSCRRTWWRGTLWRRRRWSLWGRR